MCPVPLVISISPSSGQNCLLSKGWSALEAAYHFPFTPYCLNLPLRMAHPLQHVWVLWEHKSNTSPEDWSNSMREVCEFSTVEEFWKYWCFVPKPSEVLFDGHTRKGETENFKNIFNELVEHIWGNRTLTAQRSTNLPYQNSSEIEFSGKRFQ